MAKVMSRFLLFESYSTHCEADLLKTNCYLFPKHHHLFPSSLIIYRGDADISAHIRPLFSAPAPPPPTQIPRVPNGAYRRQFVPSLKVCDTSDDIVTTSTVRQLRDTSTLVKQTRCRALIAVRDVKSRSS